MKKIPIKRYTQLITITLIVITVSGCSTSPKANFFLLEQETNLQLSGIERGLAVGLEPIYIAPYLDRPQIVTRSSNHTLELSEFNRWAESLKTSIPRVIVVNLSNILKTNRVYLLPRRNQSIPLDYQVSIDIARLDGQLGGDAKLIARWSIYDKQGNPLFTKVSVITETTTSKQYERLVAAENKVLQKLTHEIANAIHSN